MKKYRGVIFDLDGTLLNTIYDLSDSVNAVLQKMGAKEHTYEEYKLKIGRGFRNLMEVSLPEGTSEAEIDTALELFLSIYDKKYMDKTIPYEGITDVLKTLDEKGILIGVNSNKRTDYTQALVSHHFSDINFVGVIGERKGIHKKPDPVSALEITSAMNLKPEEVLYIGDSKTDIITGKNAGMDTAGVLWGFRGEEELTGHGADYMLHSPNEICGLFCSGQEK